MNTTKYAVLLVLSIGTVVGMRAQTNPQTSTTASTATPASKAKSKAVKPRPSVPLTIPAGAVKTPDGDYHFKDAQGKSWIYRNTPFGVSRAADTPRAASPAGSVNTPFGVSKTSVAAQPVATATAASPQTDPTANITATATGDTIRFQKPTPFGLTSWQKNKNDLSAEEQKVWARQQAREQASEQASEQAKETH